MYINQQQQKKKESVWMEAARGAKKNTKAEMTADGIAPSKALLLLSETHTAARRRGDPRLSLV